MSAGSMRETIKALSTTFSAPSVPYPLPDELCEAIENFLDRYDAIDDHDSQRFHEDLHTLYQRHVAGSPEKNGAFLAVLRRVRPALTGEARFTTWWNLVLKPVIDGMGHKRQELDDAQELVQSILVYDPEADKDGEHARLSMLFTRRVLDLYLARTNVPLSAEDTIAPENDFLSNELESLIVAFGRKMPKALLLALDELFVQKQYRIQALNLLSAFVRLQPPHLHLVLETPLIQHLEKCLLIDASSTVIELALVVLIMFLPHICASLTSDHHLAKMFLIYSRLLCWDRLGMGEDGNALDEKATDQDDESDEESEAEEGDTEQAWEPVQQSMEYPDSSPPTLIHYFTFLYGLFPLNFMGFVRKPRKFLKSLNFPGARDFDLDQDLIQSRTEPYRRVHLLHPNMFSTTAEEELHEHRWMKSDPADVVTECMDLCVAVTSTLEDPGPPPSAALPAIPIPPIPEGPRQLSLLDDDGTTANESNVSWRNTQSTVFVSPNEGPDAPQTFEIPPRSKSTKSIKSGKSSPLLKAHDVMDSPTLPAAKDTKKQNILGGLTSPSQGFVAKKPSLDDFVQTITASNSPGNADFRGQTMASLQREIMLLRNDLNFERYLKLQHLAHIGQLQRKHIKEATAEAETQNLINNNKTLKARLAKATELYAQLKKETHTSRNQSKKWESDLSARVRTYRESEKNWHSEEDSLRYDLQRTQSDYEHLKQIVERAEAEQTKAQQRTRALEYELEDYGNVRRELEVAQEKVLTLEDSKKELHTLLQERNDLRNDLEISNMRLNSRELERERSAQAYERRIMELETRLQVAERSTGRPGQLPSSVQQMLDSTLAASHAKLQQLKKTHYHLLDQHTELQMKYHELEARQQAERGRYQSQETSGHLDFEKAGLGRSSSMSTRHTNNYNSRYLPPISTEGATLEEREHFNDYQSPNSIGSPTSNPSPARPVRSEPVQRNQRSQPTPTPYPGFGGNYGPDFSSAYDSSLNPQFQAQPQGNAPQSSGKSSFSVDTDGSNGKDPKAKVDPKSEVRYYGRGGAQNIKKTKDKDQKKSGSSKTGGFRGLKGIM
ncbi:hypothetical protein CC86DRAFT_436914 [Ophiobolus disseminans]|uniref:Hamartin-domain-containing protein n=1 Tax=Ophiobolus disseminans TaxID=1469910 RepID=A0A6A7A773_9PLEO|nr:hypothetical protein CC86DRAFT_436914 [Ophiobolus disseminans]